MLLLILSEQVGLKRAFQDCAVSFGEGNTVTVRKILRHPDDERLLRKKSAKIKTADRALRDLVQDLRDTLAEAGGAGLAAPQIGVHLRVVVVRFGQGQGEMQPPLALINPEVIEAGPPAEGFDGCLSVPGICTWRTLRPSSLVFTALDESGKRIKLEVAGIDARLVHHEIDHLDGVLFIDRVQSTTDLYRVLTTADGQTFIRLDEYLLSG